MRTFQIIPIRISLKGNKYAKSKEIVSESQLTGPALELIEAGFIKEVFEEEVDVEKTQVITLLKEDSEEDSEEGIEKELEEEEILTETTPNTINKESIKDIKKVNKQ